MNLLAKLLKSAWAGLSRGKEGRHASARFPGQSRRDDTPDAVPAEDLFNIGQEHLNAGDLMAAERRFRAVIEGAPEFVDAHFYLGVTLVRQLRHGEATDCFALATRFRPDFAEAHFQLGLAELRLERFDDAIESYQKVIELKPDYADAHCNLGLLLYKHLEELDSAEAHLRRALELKPESIEAQTNLAMVLDHRGETDAAVALYDRILQDRPDDNEVRLNRSLIRLARGDYLGGWPGYEARHALQLRREFPFPEWDGSSLNGRTILVHAEQGLGDEIMFASCLGEILEQAEHCVVECHRKLEKLFRRSYPAATVHGALQTDADMTWLDRMPNIHCKVGIGSLPLRFRTSRAEFPEHTGYLKPDPVRVEYWRARLAGLGSGPKIGISWRGGARKTRRHARSIPLEQWGPLLTLPGVHFVSLQYGDCQGEIDAVRDASSARVHHWAEAIDDYDETAALVTALDLVISVQTAIVHLGGALGKPVWGLVSSRPEWRYQEAGDSVPWYPSVRLIRQPTPDDWQSVINEVRRRLERWHA
jgi:tetratricopeptide (TPR) repeat protein